MTEPIPELADGGLPVGPIVARRGDGSAALVAVRELVPAGTVSASGETMPRLVTVVDPEWAGGGVGAQVLTHALPLDWLHDNHLEPLLTAAVRAVLAVPLGAANDPNQILHAVAEALAEEAPMPTWLFTALAEIGVHEIRGGENPRILEYHKAAGTGQDEDEDAWCGAFMGWAWKGLGHEIPKTAGLARSWLTWGQPTEPKLGAVCVLWRGSPTGWQGHVGLLIARREGRVWLLGGNQGDAVCITSFPESQVLGYRWPT